MSTNFPHPECWNDNVRMAELFAPFRERNVNPENYDSKMRFWKTLIKDYCFYKKKAIFTQKELMLSFKRCNQEPKCLNTVLKEMHNVDIIRSKMDFIDFAWRDWILSQFIKKPFIWSINKVWRTFGFSDNSEKQNYLEYVHIEVVKDLSSQLYYELQTPSFMGTISSYNLFKDRLIEKCLEFDESSLKLCLIELYRNRKISLLYNKIGSDFIIQLIKVPDSNDKWTPINEFDVTINKIQITKGKLKNHLQNIELEIKENKVKLLHHLKRNERQIAKNCLRRQHALEKSHEKQNSALISLENLALSIEEAKLLMSTVNTYQTGSKTLRNIFKNENLQQDNVDKIIGEVQEILDIKNDIEESLANTNNNDTYVEDSDLENELNTLLNDFNENPPPNDHDINTLQQPEIKIEQNEPSTNSLLDLSDMLENLQISSNINMPKKKNEVISEKCS